MNFLKELFTAFVTVTIVIIVFHYCFDDRLVFKTIAIHAVESSIGVTLGIASIRLIKNIYNKRRGQHIA